MYGDITWCHAARMHHKIRKCCILCVGYSIHVTCHVRLESITKNGKIVHKVYITWYCGSDLRLSIMFPSTSTRWRTVVSSSCCSHMTQCLWGHPTTLLTLPTSSSWSRDSRTGEEHWPCLCTDTTLLSLQIVLIRCSQHQSGQLGLLYISAAE